jgi:hypothetical protein
VLPRCLSRAQATGVHLAPEAAVFISSIHYSSVSSLVVVLAVESVIHLISPREIHTRRATQQHLSSLYHHCERLRERALPDIRMVSSSSALLLRHQQNSSISKLQICLLTRCTIDCSVRVALAHQARTKNNFLQLVRVLELIHSQSLLDASRELARCIA